MARLAAAFYEFPSRDLLMVGVTGTNGKTTVTQILGDLLVATGFPTDVMGTLSGARTTPEATELQRVLAEVRDRQRADGQRHAVAMEVSSHALVQSRVEGIHFDVAVFTNLSHDHLDYHGTMDEYFEAKARLFSANHALRAVINADDPWGKKLLERIRIPAVAVHRAAATDLVLHPGRTEFTWRERRVRTALTGAVNVDNALLAAETALALEIDPDAIADALSSISPVPGRLEVIAMPGQQGDEGPSAFHGLRRLRAHAGRTRGGPRRGPGPGPGRTGAQRLWLRGRSGPGQAADDGRGGCTPLRPYRPDLGQSSVRESRCHHRGRVAWNPRWKRERGRRGRARPAPGHPACPRAGAPR